MSYAVLYCVACYAVMIGWARYYYSKTEKLSWMMPAIFAPMAFFFLLLVMILIPFAVAIRSLFVWAITGIAPTLDDLIWSVKFLYKDALWDLPSGNR